MALFRHRASGTFGGETWTFTLHTEGSGTAASANGTWSSAVESMWVGQLDALISADLELIERSTAQIDESTDGQLTRVDDDVLLPGAAVAEPLPFQVALVVSLSSALANRHGRGRFYLPPLTVDSVVSGRLSAAAQASVATAVGSLFTGLSGGGLSPVIRDRTNHVSTTVTVASIGDVFDTQRRRRNKLSEARVVVAV